MKTSKLISTLIIAFMSIAAITGAVTFFVYRFAQEKAHNEKWKDYIDCGLA